MTRILLLNGAPRSGKDTIATMLKNRSSSTIHIEKFATPLKLTVPLIYNVSREKWEKELDTPRNKDLACNEFFGKTPREVQISLSEDFLKPLHGKTIFGELLVRRINNLIKKNDLDSIIVSDSGFYHEAKEVVDFFGADTVELWRVHRDGCNFSKDSRGYINLHEDGVTIYDIQNNGSLDDLRLLVEPLYDAFNLPRETNNEGAEGWKERRLLAGQQAFASWPSRKIEHIKHGERK